MTFDAEGVALVLAAVATVPSLFIIVRRFLLASLVNRTEKIGSITISFTDLDGRKIELHADQPEDAEKLIQVFNALHASGADDTPQPSGRDA
ncbi:hypothetical protein [Streptosporangium sandarakinum]|uniref:hypothetical protein n=1 Tax=Streptosporangium sandarakinum TaxID=1260955 RepID=UPI003445D664